MTADLGEILVTARLLRAASQLQWLSAALIVLALTDARHPAALVSLVIGAIAQLYWFRVSFDAHLLDDVLHGRLSMEQLDSGLAAMGEITAGRSWSDRCRGARRLALIAAIATVLQLLPLIAVAWSRP